MYNKEEQFLQDQYHPQVCPVDMSWSAEFSPVTLLIDV